jgi:FMN-dependent NADH-azoreductase
VKTLLRIDSSPMGISSVSRLLTTEFTENWRRLNPDGCVITRDLIKSKLYLINDVWIAASFTSPEQRSQAQQEELQLSDELLAELKLADEIILGVPMHNFAPASAVKLFIDLIVRRGETYVFENDAPKGLFAGANKKLTVMAVSGLEYGPDSPLAGFNFLEPYLRTVFAFIGITDIEFLSIGGSAVLMHGSNMVDFLAPHVERVRTRFNATEHSI